MLLTNGATCRLKTCPSLGDATPWGIAAGVVSAGASLYGSSQASKGQQNAADQSLQEQQREYNTTRNDNAPALDARNTAIGQMANLAGQYGTGPTSADVMAQPGYQFGLNQGRNALQGSAAQAGGLYSGAAMKALEQYGNDYGTSKYQQAFDNYNTTQSNAFNRQSAIAGQGQIATQLDASAGQNLANQSTGILTNNANNQGAAWITGANQVGKAINGTDWGKVGSTVGGWFGGGGGNAGGAQGTNVDDGAFSLYDANGGPVTHEALAQQIKGRNKLKGYAMGGPVMGGPNQAFSQFQSPVTQPFANPVMQGSPITPQFGAPQQMGNTPMGMVPGSGFSGGGVNRRMAFADGGPVTSQAMIDPRTGAPMVGSHSAVRAGGGGALTPNALLTMLQQQQIAQQQAQAPTAPGQVPLSALINPRSVLDAQMQKAGIGYETGGAVAGPGGPKDDAIPAMLSNGEHVMTAASVNALGGGDNAKGQKRLNALQAQLQRKAA